MSRAIATRAACWLLLLLSVTSCLTGGLQSTEDVNDSLDALHPGPRPHAANMDPGQKGMDLRIFLKYSTFDPLVNLPDIPDDLTADDTDYVIAQFTGPIQSHWPHEVQKTGAVILGYVPKYAYLLKADENARHRLNGLSYLRWLGPYHPAYKLEPGLLTESGEVEVSALPYSHLGEQGLASVREAIKELGGTISRPALGELVPRARLDAASLRDLAKVPELMWVEPASGPQPLMDRLQVVSGAATAHSLDYKGQGVVGEVKDNGFDSDHPDFAGTLIGQKGSVTDQAHGTATFGIVFSTGSASAQAEGMLPQGQGVFSDWLEMRYQGVKNLYEAWGGVFQSNSWHEGEMDATYSSLSMEDDRAMMDFNVTMLYAAGNSNQGVGAGTLSRDCVNKNGICVGAVNHNDTVTRTDDMWVDNGTGKTPSQGPTADGRIKPDLAAARDWIYTTDSVDGDGEDGYVPGNYTPGFSGTSGATPVVAGAVGLVYQMYKADHFQNNPGRTWPNASVAKAMLIANAYQYDMQRATRYQQGWGFVNIGNVSDVGEDHFIVDQSKLLETGGSATYEIVPMGNRPLKVSLVWSDLPALPPTSRALTNDLDLRVYDPSGTEYLGNWGLNTSKYSSPGGSRDDVNNLENVFIEDPAPGVWTVEVYGADIVIDRDQGTPEFDQHFGLVASGARVRPVIMVEKTAGVASAAPGDTIEYTIHYNNTNASAIPTVWLNDTMPPDVTFVTSSAEANRTGPGNWTFHDVAPGGHNITVSVVINNDTANGTVLSNHVRVEMAGLSGLNVYPTEDTANVTVLRGPLENFTIALVDGWNLVSLPYRPESGAMADLLAGLADVGQDRSLYRYDSPGFLGSPGVWRHNSSYKPQDLNDLATLDWTSGFWLRVDATGPTPRLEVSGTPPDRDTNIMLYPGWNLVGYPSTVDDLNASQAFDDLWPYVRVYRQANGVMARCTASDSMIRGRGLWVHYGGVSQAVWDVPWQ